jgi:hypothetical protein
MAVERFQDLRLGASGPCFSGGAAIIGRRTGVLRDSLHTFRQIGGGVSP